MCARLERITLGSTYAELELAMMRVGVVWSLVKTDYKCHIPHGERNKWANLGAHVTPAASQILFEVGGL